MNEEPLGFSAWLEVERNTGRFHATDHVIVSLAFMSGRKDPLQYVHATVFRVANSPRPPTGIVVHLHGRAEVLGFLTHMKIECFVHLSGDLLPEYGGVQVEYRDADAELILSEAARGERQSLLVGSRERRIEGLRKAAEWAAGHPSGTSESTAL